MTRRILGPPLNSPSAVGVCSKCGREHRVVFGRTGNVVRAQGCRAPQPPVRKGVVSGDPRMSPAPPKHRKETGLKGSGQKPEEERGA